MLLEAVGIWWQRWKTRRKMDRVFSRGADPYGYRSSGYERSRLEAMEASLAGRRYGAVLEVGCAEGIFTALLLKAASSIDALDVSSVALERARAQAAGGGVRWFEADIRDWNPAPDKRYDLIVLGDVLYYLDKPFVQKKFEEVFDKIARWLKPSGRLILAHGFAGPHEHSHRRGFRERFERRGLRLVSERVVSGDAAAGGVSCLLSVLENI